MMDEVTELEAPLTWRSKSGESSLKENPDSQQA